MKATKQAIVVAEPAPEVPAGRGGDGRKGQTLRLTVEAWRQLKHLATDEDRTAHELLVEAVNLLFTARKLPPIA